MSRFGLRTRTGSIRSFSEGNTASNFLFDLYTSTVAGYSTRLLRSSYTGKAIRVRRSSDNTEQDIGFTVSGLLDEDALTTFVGANDGFITKWYDQSGNGYDMAQTSATSQPLIVSSGTINKINNKPSLLFDGSNDFVTSTNTTLANAFNSSFLLNLVINPNNINGGSPLGFNKRIMHSFLDFSNTLQLVINEGGLDKATSGAGSVSAGAGQFYTLNQTLFTFDTAADQGLSNNVTKNTGTSTSGNPSPWFTETRIGACAQSNGINGPYSGNIQEVVMHFGNQTSNRTGIANNINSYYTIY